MRIGWVVILLGGLAGPALAVEAPPAPPISFAFEETFTLSPTTVVGETPSGRRQSVSITGGTFSGPGFSGRVLPSGGDYQLIRADGAIQIDAQYLLETDDHVIIHARHLGTIVPPKAGGAGYFWSTHSFDAPAGKYGWLNDAVFVSHLGRTGDRDHPSVHITVWKVGSP